MLDPGRPGACHRPRARLLRCRPHHGRLDWPVCLLAADYGAVQETLDPALGLLDAAGRAAVLGGTAARWYRAGA